MPASSAIRASARLFSQVASQRSGKVEVASPPEQLAPNRPRLSTLRSRPGHRRPSIGSSAGGDEGRIRAVRRIKFAARFLRGLRKPGFGTRSSMIRSRYSTRRAVLPGPAVMASVTLWTFDLTSYVAHNGLSRIQGNEHVRESSPQRRQRRRRSPSLVRLSEESSFSSDPRRRGHWVHHPQQAHTFCALQRKTVNPSSRCSRDHARRQIGQRNRQ